MQFDGLTREQIVSQNKELKAKLAQLLASVTSPNKENLNFTQHTPVDSFASDQTMLMRVNEFRIEHLKWLIQFIFLLQLHLAFKHTSSLRRVALFFSIFK